MKLVSIWLCSLVALFSCNFASGVLETCTFTNGFFEDFCKAKGFQYYPETLGWYTSVSKTKGDNSGPVKPITKPNDYHYLYYHPGDSVEQHSLLSPIFNVVGKSSVTVTFQYVVNGENCGTLLVMAERNEAEMNKWVKNVDVNDLSASETATRTIYFVASGDGIANWKEKIISVPVNGASKIQITMQFVPKDSNPTPGDMAIDTLKFVGVEGTNPSTTATTPPPPTTTTTPPPPTTTTTPPPPPPTTTTTPPPPPPTTTTTPPPPPTTTTTPPPPPPTTTTTPPPPPPTTTTTPPPPPTTTTTPPPPPTTTTTAPPTTTGAPLPDIGTWGNVIMTNECLTTCGRGILFDRRCPDNQVCPCDGESGDCICDGANPLCATNPRHGTVLRTIMTCETPPPCDQTTTTTPPPPTTTTTPPPPTTTTTPSPPTTTTTAPPTTTGAPLPDIGTWGNVIMTNECLTTCGRGILFDRRCPDNQVCPCDGESGDCICDGANPLCATNPGHGTVLRTIMTCETPPPCDQTTTTTPPPTTTTLPPTTTTAPPPTTTAAISIPSFTGGTWDAWQEWSSCSGTCAPATEIRIRTCPNPPCLGSNAETRNCTKNCTLSNCAAVSGLNYCTFEPGDNCVWTKLDIEVATFTPNQLSGPSVDNTFGSDCGHFAYYNGATTDSGAMMSHEYTAVGTSHCFSFALSMYSRNNGQMGTIILREYDYVNARVLWWHSGDLTASMDEWKRVYVDIPTTPNKKFRMIFDMRDSNQYGVMAIDDVEFAPGLCTGKVDGSWREWTTWTTCSLSCGDEKRNRTRVCDIPRNGGEPCQGNSTETISCNLPVCPVDGNWTIWTDWGVCTKSCDGGIQIRSRFCLNPSPAGSGLQCDFGNGTRGIEQPDQRSCNLDPCSRDGQWSEWAVISNCSVECGEGQTVSQRNCTNVLGSGQQCLLSSRTFMGLKLYGMTESKAESCNAGDCAVEASWNSWGTWGSCSLSCDNGMNNATKTRSRTCNNPNNGSPCPGLDTNVAYCNLQTKCKVDGGWSEWNNLTSCSVTCGSGVHEQQRICNYPKPQHGGAVCSGGAIRDFPCEFPACPRDNENGTWTDWGSWSSCSTTCGPGLRYRNQTCSNSTGNGVILCGTVGDMRHGDGLSGTENCNIISCDAFGNWGNWSYAECSVTCGYGTRNKSRLCNNPPPGVNGLGCETAGGQTVLFENVPDDVCFVNCTRHGGWSIWTNDTCSPCDSSDGKMNQTRECNNPTPLGGGDNCTDLGNNGALTETRHNVSCFVACSINGSWSDWVNTSSCNLTCGGGYMQRERHCDGPKPVNLGLQCLETDGDRSLHEIRAFGCNNFSCPIDGEWSLWTGFSNCLPACGETLNKTRTRNCTAPQFGGLECLLENGTRGLYEVDSVTCGLPPCIVQPGWAEFGNWSECSASCTPGGKRFRTRKCEPIGNTCPLGPPNQFAESENRTEDCNLLTSCAVNGSWSDWENITGSCNVTCGVGIQQRNRTCNNPPPSDGGALCEDLGGVAAINETQNVICVLQECMINGSWSSWEDWTDCSTTCGNGTATRNRTCDDPPPSGGGLHCFDLTNSTRILFETEPMRCFIDHCPDPYDCSFDVDMCNYTSTLIPSRWLRDQNETHTQDTGPIGPQKGSHYAFYESSSEIPPGYPGGGQTYTVPNSDSIVAQYPSFHSDRCLEFYWFANQTIFAFNFGFGMMDVYQTSDVSGSMIQTPILNVTESHTFEWKRQLHQLTNVGNPFTLTFFANATSHNGDKHIDSIRFYDMLCNKVDELIIPIPK